MQAANVGLISCRAKRFGRSLQDSSPTTSLGLMKRTRHPQRQATPSGPLQFAVLPPPLENRANLRLARQFSPTRHPLRAPHPGLPRLLPPRLPDHRAAPSMKPPLIAIKMTLLPSQGSRRIGHNFSHSGTESNPTGTDMIIVATTKLQWR